MKVKSKRINHTISFFRKNPIILAFLSVGILTICLVFYKNLLVKTDYAYVKIEVNYPESYSTKPDVWLAQALKKGVFQQGLFSQKVAEIIDTTYYPDTSDSTLLNIFLDLKLQVNYDKTTQNYSFQRSSIAVGSPISLVFSSSHLIGTVLYISKTPYKNNYVDKTVYLVWPGGYKKSSPYYYDSIKIGDKYFNGENKIFEIMDRHLEKNVFAVVNNFTSQVSEGETDTTQDIVIIANMKLLRVNNRLVFGENQVVNLGHNLNLITDNGINLNGFIISAIK